MIFIPTLPYVYLIIQQKLLRLFCEVRRVEGSLVHRDLHEGVNSVTTGLKVTLGVLGYCLTSPPLTLAIVISNPLAFHR